MDFKDCGVRTFYLLCMPLKGTKCVEPQLTGRWNALGDYVDECFSGRPLTTSWIPPEHILKGKRGAVCDFMYGLPGAPVVSTRCMEAIREHAGDMAQFSPIPVNGLGPMWLMNVLSMEGIVDREKSEMSRCEEGGNVSFLNVCFFEERVGPRHVFKVAGAKTKIFVSQEFCDLVVSRKLTGVYFQRSDHVDFKDESDIPGLPRLR